MNKSENSHYTETRTEPVAGFGNTFREKIRMIALATSMISVSACGEDKPDCQPGTHLCECIGSGTCDGDLICKEKTCVNPPTNVGIKEAKKVSPKESEHTPFELTPEEQAQDRDAEWVRQFKLMKFGGTEHERVQKSRKKKGPKKQGYCTHTAPIPCQECKTESDCTYDPQPGKYYCRAGKTQVCKSDPCEAMIDSESGSGPYWRCMNRTNNDEKACRELICN